MFCLWRVIRIHSELTLRWMLEATVANSAEKLGLQKKVAETSRVDADVAALLVDVGAGTSLSLAVGGGGGGNSVVGANLLIGVIDEIFLVRHLVAGRGL